MNLFINLLKNILNIIKGVILGVIAISYILFLWLFNSLSNKNINEVNNVIDFFIKYRIVFVLIFMFWFIFFIFLLPGFFSETYNLDSLGKFGDSFNVLTSLFTGLAFAGVIISVILQTAELKETRIEFKGQKKALEEQALQNEIQQLNNWFNRNIKTIQTIKNSIFNNQVTKINSISELFYNLQSDINKHKDYLHIYDDLRNILNISINIEKYLDTLSSKNKIELIQNSIKDIKDEYNILFSQEIRDIKSILKVVYFLIVFHKKKEYEEYEIYTDWIKESNDIQNQVTDYMTSKNDVNIDSLLMDILTNKREINIDFNTGKIRN